MAEPIQETEGAAGGGDDMENTDDDFSSVSSPMDELMKLPDPLAAVSSRLDRISCSPAGYIASLPKSVKRRIKALKKLQLESIKLEAQFHQEIHALRCKYAKLQQPIYEKRLLVTSGQYEPTDEECEWHSDDEGEGEDLNKALQLRAKLQDGPNTPDDEVRGIPDFWLRVCKNADSVGDLVQEWDEPILKHLKDVRVNVQQADPVGFQLEFVFGPNEYFSDPVLTKDYEISCAVDDFEPFTFEGPEVVKSKGCTINWHKGKNVTTKTIVKKQRHVTSGTTRTVVRTESNDSFFNFFSPPVVPDGIVDVNEDTQDLLDEDYDIAEFLRHTVVPRAVLFYTGQALDTYYHDELSEGEEETALIINTRVLPRASNNDVTTQNMKNQ